MTGGAPVTICPADPLLGMSWSENGLLFGQVGKGILRVSPNGGKARSARVNEGGRGGRSSATGAKYQISKDDISGHHPVWSPDGKELLYIPGLAQFVAVSITTTPGFGFTNPSPVPKGGFLEGGPATVRSYDITPDGKHILGTIDASQAQTGVPAAPQIQVVVNWFEELKQRVPR